ncbi:hypothetical protein NL466_29665, partial [Klebsiella pneumoniae]|nr:hypothetical protein [Klebsiella pneumoniae]
MSAGSFTLLVLLGGRLIRADVDERGSQVAALWQTARPPGNGLADAVRAALSLGQRPKGQEV